MEYAVLLVALTAVLFVVAVHLRRAVSSKWRETGDLFGSGRQYNPSGPRATVVQ